MNKKIFDELLENQITKNLILLVVKILRIFIQYLNSPSHLIFRMVDDHTTIYKIYILQYNAHKLL